MAAKKKDELHQVAPVLRVAPLGELKVYTVTEEELDSISQGSPGSISLSFAIALLPLAFSFLITLLTTRIDGTVTLVFFVCACIICFLTGIGCSVLAYHYHSSATKVIARIKNRMPPPPPIRTEESEAAPQPPPSNPSE